MPPKSKETPGKKPAQNIVRPSLSENSLVNVPEDAVDGYQERIETNVPWNVVEQAVRHHKQRPYKKEITPLTFTDVLKNKIKKSILNEFLDENSALSLQELWELYLPTTLWDYEHLPKNEGKICFESDNSLTNNIPKIIKKGVLHNSRKVISEELKKVTTLRILDGEMTDIDEELLQFKELVTLNLCGNYLTALNYSFLPTGLRVLELQSNYFSILEELVPFLPPKLNYLGLSRNLLTNDCLPSLSQLPKILTVLDLADNDIYDLEAVLDGLSLLSNLTALTLAGNPCALAAAYACATLHKLQRLRWLDSREVLATDRPADSCEPHPDDLRSTYFNFHVIRVMSAPQPPKAEKGATISFYLELELPLLDSKRRSFLMYRRWDSLVEMLPPPEDDEWPPPKPSLFTLPSRLAVANSAADIPPEYDLFNDLTPKNPREILHYTVYETNRVQWNKIMNFQEPTVRIFCPDLRALRDTFRTEITVRLVYSVSFSSKPEKKTDKKGPSGSKAPTELRMTLATVKCELKRPDWSQPQQHYHWDDSLETDNAMYWGDGDLSILQYTLAPAKSAKGKPEPNTPASRQTPPDNLTCHFGFGIDTIRL